MKRNVWILVKRSSVRKTTLHERHYRIGNSMPAVDFGHVNLLLNTDRQRMAEINVGVLFVHRTPSITERSMLKQWVVDQRVAVLCGFFPKRDGVHKFASSLAEDAGAFGKAPCAQLVDVKTRSCGKETKTHPSYIICFGHCKRASLHEVGTAVPDDFDMGQMFSMSWSQQKTFLVGRQICKDQR